MAMMRTEFFLAVRLFKKKFLVMPVNTIFPEFVPDQLLTSDDLNEMFDYLDEQGRLTRSNLIGIGIVCGLQIKTPAAKNSITITKGVGVTSEGYLVRFDHDMVYNAYKSFNAVKEEYYSKFVNTGVNPKTQKFNLLELKPDITDGGTEISTIPGTLDQYIVLLFVELLQEQNKNCDPNSCDDKGIKTTVTIRPLLISKNEPNLNTLIGSTGNPLSFNPFYALPEMKMPRFDVGNTHPIQSEDLLKAYTNALSDTFLTTVETNLNTAYTTFSAFLGASVANPSTGLKTSFAFLRNLTTRPQILHLQYHYDVISDLLQAYDEFRKLGNNILSTCCPDPGLFPRHLLLGEAVSTGNLISSYRHYFIYSPLFEKKNLVLELRFLFSKMQLMKNNIFVPPFVSMTDTPHSIRITPSVVSDVPLSNKAIPYYYKPVQLYPSWSFDKTLRGKANQNLSYHAPEMNGDDEFVNTPLKYDLEPYNFLRIEGHIGMQYPNVLKTINSLKTFFRLPIDVIALSTGDADLKNIAYSAVSCNIRDIQTSYEIIRREWEAIIGKMIEYLHDNQAAARSFLSEASVGSDVLGDYLILLNRAKTFMVTELQEFISKYNDFLTPVYEEVEKQSQQLRTALMDVINNEELDKERMTLAEDIVDHFDEVVLSCKKGGFRSIYQQFSSRLNEIYSNMFFSRFVEKNPGIQHKAGVTIGGTFIIVYHKKPPSTDMKGPFTINGVARTASGAPVSFGIAQVINSTTNTTVLLNISGAFTLSVNTLPAVVRVINTSIFPFKTGEVLVSIPPTTAITVQVPSAPVVIVEPTNVFNSLQEGEVIADFYLPYICSSDCTPIQFVINEIANQGPTANAGPDQEFALPKNSTQLDGSGSKDPENKPLKFSWKLVSGQTAVVFSDDTAKQPMVTGLTQPGDYIFELTVTDEQNASHTDQVTVKLMPEPNKAPTANTDSAVSITLPNNTITLKATANDPENKPMNFAWTKQSGPPSSTFSNATGQISNGEIKETTVSNLVAGLYVFRITVTDDQDATGFAEVRVTVNPAANEPPIAHAGGPVDVTLPLSFVQLDGRASTDPEGKPLSFLWEATGNALPIFNPTSPQPIVHSIQTANDYNIKLTVTDDIGQTGTDNCLIKVKGKQRTACLSLGNIEERFQKLISGSSESFLEFLVTYQQLGDEIKPFFEKLIGDNIVGKTIPEQLKFFAAQEILVNQGGQERKVDTITALTIWIRPLFEIYQDPSTDKIRGFAMELYSILVSLAMYITCIQRKDMDAIKINTAGFFEIVHGQLVSLTPDFITTLSNAEILLLFALKAAVDDEIFVVESRGEQTFKAAYYDYLKLIREDLAKLLGLS
jgi:hypothetical protein